MAARWLLLGPLLALSALGGQAVADVPSAAPRPPVPRATPVAAGQDRPTVRSSPSGQAAPADDLDGWLGKLTGVDSAGRSAAVAAIEGASPSMVPAIAKRLSELKRTADRDAMAAALERARNGSGDERSRKGSVDAEGPFERIMATATPTDAGWRDLASVLGLSRLLARIGTTPAVRELAGTYAGFGDLVRLDVERQLKALGERAVATLIELRRGEAKPQRAWAAKLLDALGKTLPGEAVQTADNQVLSDVLRAYGRTKDTDAARVIVSFANSDRTQVREAAREAVAMLGENGIWQLRESYENLVGKKPPEEWGWEKLAGELFAAFDKARLSEVYALMAEGLAAYKAGKLDAMAIAFDRVLARAPNFDKRRDMVPGYIDYARSVRDADRPRALSTLRRVVRIDPKGPRAREAESELAYLDALDLASRGVVDETAYRRAVELDPNNVEAKEALSRIQAKSDSGSGGLWRYLLGALLVLLALASAAAAYFWRRPAAG